MDKNQAIGIHVYEQMEELGIKRKKQIIILKLYKKKMDKNQATEFHINEHEDNLRMCKEKE